MKQFAIILALTATVVCLAGCGREEAAPAVLARVGDRVITPEEFRLNYAFGYGHLRRGDTPRRDYLGFMIREAVLAQEAEKIRLDTAEAIRHATRMLTEELRIERVFEEKVLSRIEVTDAEIRKEVDRAAVSFRFRFLPAPSEQAAHDLYAQVQAEGFEAVVAANRAAFAELGAAEADLQSPFVRAEDVEPDILAVIQDLPVGTPSEPVAYRGGWYVFEVQDVRRDPLAEADYREKAPTYRKVLYNKKAMEGATAFVAATMEPLHVATKRPGFEVLNAALWDWYRQETPVRNLLYYLDEEGRDAPYARKLVSHYRVPLVAFGEEHWTIRDFLAHFTPGRYVLRAREPAAFKARLADVVALVVRDAVFLAMAEEEGLENSAAYQRTLALWKDKWLFQEFKNQLVDSSAVTESDVQAYYEGKQAEMEKKLYPYERLSAPDRRRIRTRMMQETLEQYVARAAASYAVEINEKMLDTLTLSVSEKNPYMTVHLLKNNSNKMPFPIVDPNWRLEASP